MFASRAVPHPGSWTSRAAAIESALDGMSIPLRCCILACCLLPAAICAYWRPLTNDELFTFEVARLGSVAEVMRALAAGADNHPPLDYVLRHLSMFCFGASELAFRLPSLLAVWTALACIYAFVARRTSAVYGLVSVFILLSTPLFEFAYEARAYALVVAFGALALCAWERRTFGSRVSLFVLAASLSAAVWSHYYGVLIFVPIAFGELARTADRRRIDWGVWAALGTATAAVLPLAPFIRAASRIGSVFWTKVGLVQAVYIYPALLERLCIVAALTLCILLPFGLPPRSREVRRLPRHEAAALVGFILLPVLVYVIARAFTGALAPRYALATVVGVAAALGIGASEALSASPVAGLAVAAVLAMFAAGTDLTFALKQRQLRVELNRDNLEEVIGSAPRVVMTDNDLIMQLWHYKPAEVGRRLIYVADEKGALEFNGWNTPERAFAGLKPWTTHIHIESFDEFLRSGRRCLLIEGAPSYVSRNLIRDGGAITARGMYRNQFVFEVELPTSRAAALR
jgi:hypothetical protein